jgi:hypothetical protein
MAIVPDERLEYSQVPTLSSCSKMHECKSSAISRYFKAYWAAFCADVTDALSWRKWWVKRMRTSKGSAILMKVMGLSEAKDLLWLRFLVFYNCALDEKPYWRECHSALYPWSSISHLECAMAAGLKHSLAIEI